MQTSIKQPRKGSKLAVLVTALGGRGSSLEKLCAKLGWQPHTVRAAMTRLRQRGYVITRAKSSKTGLSIFKVSEESK